MSEKLNISLLKLIAGTTWSWLEMPSSFPASYYSLTIYLKKGTNAAITLIGTNEGNSFRFTKPANETSQLEFGEYKYQAIADDGNGNVDQVDSGNIQILPLLTASGDLRSYWEIIRDNAQEAYKKLTSRETDEVSINGKTFKFSQRNELLKTIRIAEAEIEREKAEQSGPKIYRSRFI